MKSPRWKRGVGATAVASTGGIAAGAGPAGRSGAARPLSAVPSGAGPMADGGASGAREDTAGAPFGWSSDTAGAAAFAPQNGQAGALSEMRLPHARHAISIVPPGPDARRPAP